MFNFDDITNENNEDHNKKWPDIPNHPYMLMIVNNWRFRIREKKYIN